MHGSCSESKQVLTPLVWVYSQLTRSLWVMGLLWCRCYINPCKWANANIKWVAEDQGTCWKSTWGIRLDFPPAALGATDKHQDIHSIWQCPLFAKHMALWGAWYTLLRCYNHLFANYIVLSSSLEIAPLPNIDQIQGHLESHLMSFFKELRRWFPQINWNLLVCYSSQGPWWSKHSNQFHLPLFILFFRNLESGSWAQCVKDQFLLGHYTFGGECLSEWVFLAPMTKPQTSALVWEYDCSLHRSPW